MTYAAITFLCLMWAGFLGICLLAWWLARSVNKEITKPRKENEQMTYLRGTSATTAHFAASLPEEMARLAHTRITQALHQTNGNKKKAAELLGLPSYQTLTNWIKKYGVEHE